MARRKEPLSPSARRFLIAAATVEAGLKAAALLDMRRRPASQIRGSKKAWAMAMIVNSAGLIPICYFVFGVRRAETPDQTPDETAAHE
jgi:hypothetical protein